MIYSVDTIGPFRRQVRKLVKKYPSLKNELNELGNKLSHNPKLGIAIGNNCYKIRLAIKSKGKGKSGGARVITHLYLAENKVFLLTIYDKSNLESISDREIKALLDIII